MPTGTHDMTAQEALDALRALKGARDALMGFDAALSKIADILHTVDHAEDILRDKRQLLADIEADIQAASDRQRQAAAMEEKAAKHLADVKTALSVEQSSCEQEAADFRAKRDAAAAEVKATVEQKRQELEALNAQIEQKQHALNKLQTAFLEFKREHAL